MKKTPKSSDVEYFIKRERRIRSGREDGRRKESRQEVTAREREVEEGHTEEKCINWSMV